MHSSKLLVVGGAALAAAAPATIAAINFAAILSATVTVPTGPTLGAPTQTAVYNAAAAASSASAVVTSIASAASSASVAARDVHLEARMFCIFGFCFGTTTSSKPAYPTTTTTPSAVITTPAVTTTAPAITYPPISVPSTCTPVSWTNTNAFTTATDCAAPYEVGTYCGFVNPEDPCAAQPGGSGLVVQPDTPDAFLAWPDFHKAAQNAPTPSGYASTFKDLNASVSANTYLGMYTFTTYDVATCASKCDSTNLCTAFNIFIERDPAWNGDQCSCDNPTSQTNYKCTLWGSGVDAVSANNAGQWRGPFDVVITGSNGYAKSNNTTPTTPGGWTNPKNCSGSVHNHPGTCLGQKFFPGPFDVNVCAAYAASQNTVNAKWLGWLSWLSYFGYHPMHCNFFNAFMIKQNGVPKGTYCSIFAQQYEPSAATYSPPPTSGVNWGVETSWSFCSSS